MDYGGQIVAIDQYPYRQFKNGVKIDEEQKSANSQSAIARYEIECQSEDFNYNAIVLLIPGRESIVLSTLKIALSNKRGFFPSFIALEKETVLSVTLPFGEVKGIALIHCSESALNPDADNLRYAMNFEKISLPAVILQKLLETKP